MRDLISLANGLPEEDMDIMLSQGISLDGCKEFFGTTAGADALKDLPIYAVHAGFALWVPAGHVPLMAFVDAVPQSEGDQRKTKKKPDDVFGSCWVLTFMSDDLVGAVAPNVKRAVAEWNAQHLDKHQHESVWKKRHATWSPFLAKMRA